jgi:hypothetical protein
MGLGRILCNPVDPALVRGRRGSGLGSTSARLASGLVGSCCRTTRSGWCGVEGRLLVCRLQSGQISCSSASRQPQTTGNGIVLTSTGRAMVAQEP